tara:strand:- start:261 stop:464 length:204 start_codon:yes stop_codon:yes gene_type:complete
MNTIEVTNWNGKKESINRGQFEERWYEHNREIRGLAFDLQSQNEVDAILEQLTDLADRAFSNKLKGE